MNHTDIRFDMDHHLALTREQMALLNWDFSSNTLKATPFRKSNIQKCGKLHAHTVQKLEVTSALNLSMARRFCSSYMSDNVIKTHKR